MVPKVLAITLIVLATGASAIALGGSGGSSAAAARALSVRDEGHLSFVRGSGQRIIDEGSVSGTLPGKARAYFSYDGNPAVSAQFEIWGSGWSISGHGSGRMNNPNGPSPSFRGSLMLTGGSGRFAHASGSGELFGVFSRRNYGLIVQTITELRY